MFSIDSKNFKMKKICCIMCNEYRKFKNPKKYPILFLKKKVFLLFAVSVAMNIKKYSKKKNELNY